MIRSNRRNNGYHCGAWWPFSDAKPRLEAKARSSSRRRCHDERDPSGKEARPFRFRCELRLSSIHVLVPQVNSGPLLMNTSTSPAQRRRCVLLSSGRAKDQKDAGVPVKRKPGATVVALAVPEAGLPGTMPGVRLGPDPQFRPRRPRKASAVSCRPESRKPQNNY